MIEIRGDEIMRGGSRIGYIRGNDIYSHSGAKLGYVRDNHIYNHSGRKLGWVQGDYVKTEDGKSLRIDDMHRHVSGGEVSDEHRAAIRFLLGD